MIEMALINKCRYVYERTQSISYFLNIFACSIYDTNTLYEVRV